MSQQFGQRQARNMPLRESITANAVLRSPACVVVDGKPCWEARFDRLRLIIDKAVFGCWQVEYGGDGQPLYVLQGT